MIISQHKFSPNFRKYSAPRSRARLFHVTPVVPRCNPLANRRGAVVLSRLEDRRTQDADDDAGDKDLEDAFGVGIHGGEDTSAEAGFNAGPKALRVTWSGGLICGLRSLIGPEMKLESVVRDPFYFGVCILRQGFVDEFSRVSVP